MRITFQIACYFLLSFWQLSKLLKSEFSNYLLKILVKKLICSSAT